MKMHFYPIPGRNDVTSSNSPFNLSSSQRILCYRQWNISQGDEQLIILDAEIQTNVSPNSHSPHSVHGCDYCFHDHIYSIS